MVTADPHITRRHTMLINRIIAFAVYVPLLAGLLVSMLPFLTSGQPGTNVIANYTFMMIILSGVAICFKVPWPPLLNFSLVALYIIPVLFAVSSFFALISWAINPYVFGTPAEFTIENCKPDSGSYYCTGTMQLNGEKAEDGFIYSQSNHNESEIVKGAAYSDPVKGSGYFQEGSSPPKLNPMYAIAASSLIIIPPATLLLLREHFRKTGISGWFWNINQSALSSRTAQLTLQIAGIALFGAGLTIFAILMAADLQAEPGNSIQTSAYLQMSSGDYLTISGIGLTVASAVESLAPKSQKLLNRFTLATHRRVLHATWTLSLYVSSLSIAMISLRLANPLQHNLIPIITRPLIETSMSSIGVLDNAFSWANILAIFAISVTIMLLTFTENRTLSHQMDRRIVQGTPQAEVSRVLDIFYLTFTTKFSEVQISELNALSKDAGRTKTLLTRMRLITEAGNGTVKPTNLGRSLIEG